MSDYRYDRWCYMIRDTLLGQQRKVDLGVFINGVMMTRSVAIGEAVAGAGSLSLLQDADFT